MMELMGLRCLIDLHVISSEEIALNKKILKAQGMGNHYLSEH